MLLNGLLRTLHLYSNTVKDKNIIKTLDTLLLSSTFFFHNYYTRKIFGDTAFNETRVCKIESLSSSIARQARNAMPRFSSLLFGLFGAGDQVPEV